MLSFVRVIKGITDDSRKFKKGYLFVDINALTSDGHKYIPQAVKKGAAVIVGEQNLREKLIRKTSYIRVKNSR